jgi:hypothetical protein
MIINLYLYDYKSESNIRVSNMFFSRTNLIFQNQHYSQTKSPQNVGPIEKRFELISHRDKNTGHTALTLAMKQGMADVCQLLLMHPEFSKVLKDKKITDFFFQKT